MNSENQRKAVEINEKDINPIAEHAATLACALYEGAPGSIPPAVLARLQGFEKSCQDLILAENQMHERQMVMAQRANDLLASVMNDIVSKHECPSPKIQNAAIALLAQFESMRI